MRRARSTLGSLLALWALLLSGCASPPEDPPTEPREPDVDASLDVPGPGIEGDGPASPQREPAGDDPAPSRGTDPPPPPASRQELVAEAGRLLAGAVTEAPEARFGVLVVDEHGRAVAEHGADELLLPASTLKIVTAAAALVTFGPEAHFTTSVELTAPIDADGTLDGALLLRGSGDPVLATEEFARWVHPARPRTALEQLADAVVSAGVQRITGDVVGLADGFEGPPVADGWPDRYFRDFDARFADGLSVDAGLRTILTYPELEDDEREGGSERTREEAGSGAGRDGSAPGESTGGAGGDVREDIEPTVRIEHADEPARQAAAELVRLLEQRGVEVAGTADAHAEVLAPAAGRIASVESPSMEELLRFAVQRSDNQISDAIFRALGRARTGVGSFASGERAVRQALDHLGVDHERAGFADGSGLSRDDRVTARLLADVDRAMLGSRHAGTWTSLMAVTGRTGTLRGRLRNTVADGRFAGKTGTLRDVSALVGTVHGRGPRRYHLAVLVNDPGGGRWVGRVLADELIRLLTADLDACEVDRADDRENELGRAPLLVRC